ncbi:hypothetical protein [Alteribacillus sp. YIM 98480]|uniref:hypothetical protein n=1 Tax=Alteribacillus sp. YIM 98480 TaxID=2606599 RepID=UPI00131D4431|nr:hypothetical protein [Alteribacillus sp. YIM 98480]
MQKERRAENRERRAEQKERRAESDRRTAEMPNRSAEPSKRSAECLDHGFKKLGLKTSIQSAESNSKRAKKPKWKGGIT